MCPGTSPYSLLLSVSIFFLAAGLVFKVNGMPAGVILYAGAIGILYVLVGWFGDIIRENAHGVYRRLGRPVYRIGMVWFIFSRGDVLRLPVRWPGTTCAASRCPSWAATTHRSPYAGFAATWPSAGPLGDAFTWAFGPLAVNTLLLLTRVPADLGARRAAEEQAHAAHAGPGAHGRPGPHLPGVPGG